MFARRSSPRYLFTSRLSESVGAGCRLCCGDNMITAAEYRAWAEESLEWAYKGASESSRQACIRWAEIWLESALRVERLAALLEHPSKEPMLATDHEWVLPPFGEWRPKGTSL
jgi:hypothetical protein